MMKYRDQISTTKFSRFAALSSCAWLLIICIASITLFYYHFELNFKTKFTQINSYLVIYQQRGLISIVSAIIIALFLLTIYVRIFSFKTHPFTKFLCALIPTLFIASLTLLILNLYWVVIELNIPLSKGIFTLQKYFKSLSIELVNQAIATLPYQSNSLKIPFYSMLYSYFIMFTMIIIIPLEFRPKMRSVWQKINVPFIILFIIAFAYSVYALSFHYIFNNPFNFL